MDNMISRLEGMNASGRSSVRVGATGTIISLVNKELASVKTPPQLPKSPKPTVRATSRNPVSVLCASRLGKHSRKTAVDEASTSGNNNDHGGLESNRKTGSIFQNNSHTIPMLGSDDVVINNGYNKKRTWKRGSYNAEVIDLKCESYEKPWSNLITVRIRKLSFSKLSKSFS